MRTRPPKSKRPKLPNRDRRAIAEYRAESEANMADIAHRLRYEIFVDRPVDWFAPRTHKPIALNLNVSAPVPTLETLCPT